MMLTCYASEYGSPTHWLDPEGHIFTRGKRIFHLELVNMGLPFVLFYAVGYPRVRERV
jgi:hypothetical protein